MQRSALWRPSGWLAAAATRASAAMTAARVSATMAATGATAATAADAVCAMMGNWRDARRPAWPRLALANGSYYFIAKSIHQGSIVLCSGANQHGINRYDDNSISGHR